MSQIPVSGTFADRAARVRTEEGSAAFQKGREYRVYLEVIKAAADVWYIQFNNTVPVLLKAINISVDNGSVRYSSRAAPTFTGVFTPLTAMPTNAAVPLVPSTTTVGWAVSTAGQVVDSGERDVIRVRSGTGTKTTSSGSSLRRGLSVGNHAIKLEPITGVADANAVNGMIEIVWSELPDEV